MSLNFFEPTCQEPPLTNDEFGLCDDQNGTKAYTDIKDQSKWIATVKNKQTTSVVFTAIDKCVIKDNEQTGRGRCDGMLTTANCLYLVELKDSVPPWKADAIDQLISTVQFITNNHDLSVYKHKKAFACNKQRDKFQVIDNEVNLAFRRKYGFRIDIQAEIIII